MKAFNVYGEEEDKSCSVVEQGCTAPPGLMDSRTKARCYACGLPVCVKCSRRRDYLRYGRRRICLSCIEEMKK